MKVVLLENIHPQAASKLSSDGFEVAVHSGAMAEEDLARALEGADAVGIRSKTQLTANVIEGARNLKVIGAFCIGTNQIDLAAANRCGIPVFNAPYSNTRSVAELVIAEIIGLARRLTDVSSAAHRGEWLKSASGNHEVRGKTLGIIGYGHIGSQLSVLAEAIGLRVVFYDIVKKLPLGNAVSCDSLQDLLGQSDFVSLHVPETEQTREMMTARELGQMKAGSYLINASRGTVVVLDALAEALRSGHIAGAAIDVFPSEPKNNKESFENVLQGIGNVILTPHVGGSTEEAQYKIGQEVSHSLCRFLQWGATAGAVNFPQVDPPTPGDATRLINVHRNEPGVLGEMNSIVSDMGVNIRAQYLSTDPQIGYLVMDIEGQGADVLASRIADLSKSIKTRVI